MRQIALGAAGFLADQAHGFKLVEQIAAAGVDVAQAIDQLAAGVLHRRHDGRIFGLQRVVIGQRDSVDARAKAALVRHAGDLLAVEENPGLVAAQ